MSYYLVLKELFLSCWCGLDNLVLNFKSSTVVICKCIYQGWCYLTKAIYGTEMPAIAIGSQTWIYRGGQANPIFSPFPFLFKALKELSPTNTAQWVPNIETCKGCCILHHLILPVDCTPNSGHIFGQPFHAHTTGIQFAWLDSWSKKPWFRIQYDILS